MRAYSLDLRQRVLKAYDEEKWTVRQLAERFKVGERWIYKLKRQRKAGSGVGPRKGKVGQPRRLGPEQVNRLEQFVDKHPDATLEQMHEKIGANCTMVTIHNTLKRLGYRYKKTLRASERDHADIVEKRTQWKELQQQWPGSKLVFIDESSAKTNMTRLRGRVRGGRRLHDHTPGGRWRTVTMLGSIRLDGVTSCMVIEGATDSDVFREYVRQVLGPTLRPGDIVVCDNLVAQRDVETFYMPIMPVAARFYIESLDAAPGQPLLEHTGDKLTAVPTGCLTRGERMERPVSDLTPQERWPTAGRLCSGLRIALRLPARRETSTTGPNYTFDVSNFRGQVNWTSQT